MMTNKVRISAHLHYTVEKKSGMTSHVWSSLPDHDYGVSGQVVTPLDYRKAIATLLQELNELKCEVAALEIVCDLGLNTFPYKELNKALTDKRFELVACTERLKYLYDLQLIHLRASVLDCHRYLRSCACLPMQTEEFLDRIDELQQRINIIFNAKSQLL